MKATDVKRFRKRLGLTQVLFADFLGITQSTVSKWERGQPIGRYGRSLLKEAEHSSQRFHPER